MSRATTERRPRRRPPQLSETPAPPPAPPPESPGLALSPPPEPAGLEPAASEPAAPEPGVPVTTPEPAFAARVPEPEPEPPRPATRRVIFFDVENTSRPEHIARMIGHLAIDARRERTEFVAVGNWRVIGGETARLLAQHGAQLVHSAPSTGVRDWSDLRIAVSAGVWLAGARPGDVLELVSDDRAFDAVGDVAVALGIAFRRLSYRTLAGTPLIERVEDETPIEQRGRRGRRGRRGGRPRRPFHAAPAHDARPEHQRDAPARDGGDAAEPHTAPHDEIIHLVRDLMQGSNGQPVLIDTLANALKARGFRRPPGSPRLITRLRRIKELSVSPSGMIALAPGVEPAAGAVAEGELVEPAVTQAEIASPAVESAEPAGLDAAPVPAEQMARRRRRSRRGGRRHRRRGPAQAPGA